MHLLIKNVHVADPNSAYNGRKVNVLIQGGVITKISSDESMIAAEEIDAEGYYISPGFMDMRAHFCDPGFEYKETLESGCWAAAAGGFTAVALLPSTQPPVHSKSEVEYIINKSRPYLTDVYPMGCITHAREGKELAEMYDMHKAGAIAFTDGNHPITDSGLVHRAMLYAKGFDGLLCLHAEDNGLTQGAQMNEGVNSTHLGMKGMPNLAEYLAVKRDLEIARYNKNRVHFSHVSTAEAVELIREAKKEGLHVTADVAIHNLVFDDGALHEYDANYKVNPPLRTKKDIEAMLEGLSDGTIDAICSDHTPEDVENKQVEFDYAAFGMIGLQTFLPMYSMIKDKLSLATFIEKAVVNPRKIFGLEMPVINNEAKANLTVFSLTDTWTYNSAGNFSKSANSPLMGKELAGKVLLTINNSEIHRNNQRATSH